MNAKQAAAVEWLREQILAHDSFHHEGYEYKKFDVVEHEGFISVSSVVGLIGDEGTWAQRIRHTRQIFIGKRGGMKLVNAAKLNKKTKEFEPSTPVYGKRVAYWCTMR